MDSAITEHAGCAAQPTLLSSTGLATGYIAVIRAMIRARTQAISVSRARFVLPPPWHEEQEQGASLSERVERRVRKFVEGVERENLGNFPDLLGFVANLHAALPSLMRSTALYLAAHRSQ